MTIARAVIRPGKWGARDNTWPRVDLSYVAPIAGAYYDWAADQLPLGQLTQWESLTNGVPLLTDGSAPTVVNSGGAKAVRFDGQDNLMRGKTPGVPAQHTVISIFRLLDPKPADAAIFGYNNANGGTITVGTDGSMTFTGYVNGTFLIPSPVVPADTSWHIAMLVSDGPNSAFRIDDQERVGAVTSQLREGIALGYNNNTANKRGAIEYRRDIILPPLNPTERAAMYSKLKTAYGI